MKKIKYSALCLALIIIVTALASCSASSTKGHEVDVIDFQIRYSQVENTDSSIFEIVLASVCEDVQVTVNDKMLNIHFLPEWHQTIVSFDTKDIPHNELLDFDILLLDSAGNQVDRLLISDVCISTDGQIPGDAKTLFLYDYHGYGYPEFYSNRLKSIYIVYSTVSEEIEIELDDIKDIASLESLCIVSMGNVGGEMKSLKALESLRRLSITDGITGDLDAIDALYGMQIIELVNTNIKGHLKDLVPLNSLTQIKLFANSYIIGDVGQLSKFTLLESLKLQGYLFEGEVLDFVEIPSLERLALADTLLIKGNIYVLEDIKNLEQLNLARTGGISGNLSSLKSFTSLKSLILISTPIKGDIKDLSTLLNLETISIMYTSDIVGSLSSIDSLLGLRRIHIHATDISGTISELTKFTNLNRLWLGASSITGDIAELANAKNLRELWLTENNLISGDIGTLDSLSHLSSLIIENCPNLAGDIILYTGEEVSIE